MILTTFLNNLFGIAGNPANLKKKKPNTDWNYSKKILKVKTVDACGDRKNLAANTLKAKKSATEANKATEKIESKNTGSSIHFHNDSDDYSGYFFD